jgi:hypothetical protein
MFVETQVKSLVQFLNEMNAALITIDVIYYLCL